LGFKGWKTHSNYGGTYLDDKKYWPILEIAEKLDVPIFLHPNTPISASIQPYLDYGFALAGPAWGFGAEAALETLRLIYSGIFEKYPNLKVITHHLGGMVPYYEQRIVQHYSQRSTRYHDYAEYMKGLSKPPIEYYKMFYNDTAIHGNTPALMLAYHFWGADHIVFWSRYAPWRPLFWL
jgi:predicted TIM-barrel fold metal-dependent hydrolase